MHKIIIFLMMPLTVVAADLDLSITARSPVLRPKEIPEISATLGNHSNHDISLVLPGDGSWTGIRTPLVGWSVVPVDSTNSHPMTPPRYYGGSCGNVNPLKNDELILLKPGEVIPLNWIGFPTFERTGDYRVVFYYQNIPDFDLQMYVMTGRVLGSNDIGVIEKIRTTHACLLQSNELKFKIEDPAQQGGPAYPPQGVGSADP